MQPKQGRASANVYTKSLADGTQSKDFERYMLNR